MSQSKVQATRVIHFSQVYGSMQLYLECNKGDLYQNYIPGAGNTVTPTPSYHNLSAANQPRVKARFIQGGSAANQLYLDFIKWFIGTTELQFGTASGGLCGAASPYSGIFALDDTTKELVVTDDFVNALNKQSVMLFCEAKVMRGTEEVTSLRASMPITIREINQNGYDIHIVPSQGSTIGIMQNDNTKLQFCKLTAAVSQGEKEIALTSLGTDGMSIKWQKYDPATSDWADIALTPAYETKQEPSTVKVPRPTTRNDWKEIAVPCGAVDSQLVIRAVLVKTTGSGSGATTETLAMDVATVYDNTDELIISPRPSRDEEFVLGGTSEQTSDIEYTPRVMQGDNDVTVSGGWQFSYKLLGSAGENLAPSVPDTSGTNQSSFKVKAAHFVQAIDLMLVITATQGSAS